MRSSSLRAYRAVLRYGAGSVDQQIAEQFYSSTLIGRAVVRYDLLRYEVRRRRENAIIAIAHRIPTQIAYWVIILAWSKAMTGNRTPDSITVSEVLAQHKPPRL